MGMYYECIISYLKGYIDEMEVEHIRDGVCKFMIRIPFGGKDFSAEEIYSKILHDKKSESGVVKWTLLGALGKAVIDQKVSLKMLKEAMRYAAHY